jgi:hypothetical protein
MKKSALLLSVIFLAVFSSCEENASKKVKAENVEVAADRDAKAGSYPVMTFDKTEHDFGEIEARAAQETIFKFTNTGTEPLVVANATSSCGCTVPTWSKDPIAPGETGEMVVKFNGSGQNQVQKTITVTANTEKGKETIRIKAFVKPDPNKVAPAVNAPTGK